MMEIPLQINPPPSKKQTFALWELGFRPFFLGGAVFAVFSMLFWIGLYRGDWDLPLHSINPLFWHGHAMLFGYAGAIIAGFLLTAVKNWTGAQTSNHRPLMLLFLLWLAARIMPFIPISDTALAIQVMMVLDLLFMGGLIVALSIPIIRVKQWKQSGILSKLLLLWLANLLFYLGALGIVSQGIQWGLYSGLYLILSMVFLMARRVLPFFIERGVDEKVSLSNWKWIDNSSLVVLLLLWIIDVFYPIPWLISILAGALFIMHSIRLYGWHTPGIWQKPMIWVLYLAYSFLVVGFALKALSMFYATQLLALHAFAVGGIGLLTVGMMARVALGHTARNIFEPPVLVRWIFALVLLSGIIRVLPPLLLPDLYNYWILISQILWIAGFSLFTWLYFPILIQPRLDGRPG
ncbi:NnrS family protein [Candidatus Venteria ishoeyi]|uniref:NnrS family protein n=1 Tax=Candidatus Venteria ishoeyi TaxID=1899563 RepID=UPI0025A4EA6B|nr:NnrS family protein [Candidatus Venteria ishoeyi]MDM8547917.1 NnrS family protein [Candidatus Venteria ishoeyi]